MMNLLAEKQGAKIKNLVIDYSKNININKIDISNQIPQFNTLNNLILKYNNTKMTLLTFQNLVRGLSQTSCNNLQLGIQY